MEEDLPIFEREPQDEFSYPFAQKLRSDPIVCVGASCGPAHAQVIKFLWIYEVW